MSVTKSKEKTFPDLKNSNLALSESIFSSEKIVDLIFKSLFDSDAESIYVKDLQSRFMLVNNRVINELGIKNMDEVIGKTDIDLFGEEFGVKTRQEEILLFETGESVEGIVEGRNINTPEKYWTSTTKIPLRDEKGQVIGLIGITRNISGIKLHEHKLEIQATHDPLTNIYNRIGLMNNLQEMVKNPDKLMAVLAIDLDNFKRINDNFYHKTGDEFLIWFSWLLKSTLRGNDIAARVGGDEFVLILEKIKKIEDAAAFCKKLYHNYSQSIDQQFADLDVNLSIGISIFPINSQKPVDLINQADRALYEVKNHGKGTYSYFS